MVSERALSVSCADLYVEIMRRHWFDSPEMLRTVDYESWVNAGLPLGLLLVLRDTLSDVTERDIGRKRVKLDKSCQEYKSPLALKQSECSNFLQIFNQALSAADADIFATREWKFETDSDEYSTYFRSSLKFRVPYHWDQVNKREMNINSEWFSTKRDAQQDAAKQALIQLGARLIY